MCYHTLAWRRQAFGAGSYRLVGVVLQRAVILTSLLVVAVAWLWSQAERLLLALGQDAAIATGVGAGAAVMVACTGLLVQQPGGAAHCGEDEGSMHQAVAARFHA